MQRFGEFGLVALGGFAGAAARYAVGLAVSGAAGTLAVNVVGSFLLGALTAAALSSRLGLLVGAGGLSSFTTYSTFAVETVSLGPLPGAANVGATYVLGVAAALAGLTAGRRL
ncbi:MAG: CrcB family protein [Halolamina sp.]